MKRQCVTIVLFLLFFTYFTPLGAQTRIWFEHVQLAQTSVRGAPVIVSQLDVDIPEEGNILLQFNGQAFPGVGDRLILAASDNGDWQGQDGSTGFEIPDTDVNSRSFSHTRMYPVTPGAQSFYAVAENAVEVDGHGLASVYGTFTAKFFPERENEPFVRHLSIVEEDSYVRGAPLTVGELDIDFPQNGKVLVRFDGMCYSSPGDMIYLAASDHADWEINDDNIKVEAISSDVNISPFCHTRMYTVTPGRHRFFALVENFNETAGNGIVYVYGSLTVEYYPDQPGSPFVMHEGIIESGTNFRSSTVVLAQQVVNVPFLGRVWVHFDGVCAPDEGDRIILSATHDSDWHSNDGNVQVEAASATVDRMSFSHARVYEVTNGYHDFEAVAINEVEKSGSGYASVYGSLSVVYIPTLIPGVDHSGKIPHSYKLEQNFPNPFNPSTTIEYALPEAGEVSLVIYNVQGQVLETVRAYKSAGTHVYSFDGSGLPSGVYTCELKAGGRFREMKKMLLLR